MTEQVELFEFEKKRPTIKGFPELHWTGKRPFRSTQYYPAQLKETYGEPDESGWLNKIFWGDNLQVMSHLLKDFRGNVDLIYIDPPFDSKADYKKKIKIKGLGDATSDSLAFEEKQYSDIWTNDEYLQFMYERLILIRELLSPNGLVFVHCDWHKNSYLRIILDEVFGPGKMMNEIVWTYFGFKRKTARKFPQKHDLIYGYANGEDYTWNVQYVPHSAEYISRFKTDENGRKYRDDVNPTGGGTRIIYLDEFEGDIVDSVWSDIPPVNPVAKERQNYPTQKPEALIERIIKASTNENDIVFDCFMGSGTTQAVATKLNRRFIGADINLGAVQTTTKRLAKLIEEKNSTGFEVYNVNNYDFFRNEVEAKQLVMDALSIQPMSASNVYDGELDGRMVKIMPINRITTRVDLGELIHNLPYDIFEKRKVENPNEPVERITIVCMGHEPDLKAAFSQEVGEFKIDLEIVDILRDKANLQLKRDSSGSLAIRDGKLYIESFYPMNLLQKLSLQKEGVEDWKQLVESVMIDFNYDGVVLAPSCIDIPTSNELVKGVYDIPEDTGTIRVKVTDVLSESLELEVK